MTDPQPYQFGRAAPQSPALLATVDRVSEKLARRLRALVEPLSGTRPIIGARSAERMDYAAWDAVVPPFCALGLYRLHPVKGVTVLRIDAPFASLLVDRFYGGAGAPDTRAREFTPTETRLVDRLSGQVMAALANAWAEHVAMSPVAIGRETATGQADLRPAGGDFVVQGFDINIGGREEWTIEIAYPADALCELEALSAPRMSEEAHGADPVWRSALAERMEDVRLPARTILARLNLRMSELMALKPGDVIDIHVARHLPLLIGERVFAHGTVGEQDGRAAFMINKLA